MTVTTSGKPTVPRLRRALIGLAAGAVVFTGFTTLTAEPAAAAPQSASTATLVWGLRDSLIGYHFNHPGGQLSIEQSGVTQFGSATRTYTHSGGTTVIPARWSWPFVSATFDPATNAIVAQYGGSVTLKDDNPAPTEGPGGATSASPFKYMKFANPKITLTFNGNQPTGKIQMELTQGATSTTPGSPVTVEMNDLDFGTYTDDGGVLPAVVDTANKKVTYNNVASVLSAAGSTAVGEDFTNAGDTYGAVNFSVTYTDAVSPTPTPDPSPDPTPGPTPDPTPTPAPGAISNVTFEWPWNDYVQKQNQGNCFFMTAGDSSPISAAAYTVDNYDPKDGNVTILKDGTEPNFANKCFGTGSSTRPEGLNQKIRWTGGSGTRDAVTGAATVNFTGTMAVNYNNQIRIKDPVLTVNTDGTGTLKALVAAVSGSPAALGAYTAQPVEVATFAGIPVDKAGGFTSVPIWDNRTITLTSGSTPTQAVQDFWTTQNVAWGAWPQEFVTALPPAIQAFFYASGSTGSVSDANKQKRPTGLSVYYNTSGPFGGAQNLAVNILGNAADPFFTWTIPNNPTVNLTGGALIAGNLKEYTGNLNPVQVTDNRTASGATWSVSGIVSAFSASGLPSIPAYRLGWLPTATAGAGASAAPAILAGSAAGGGLSVSCLLASGLGGQTVSVSTLGAGLTFRVPRTTPSGTYAGVLTLTATAV